jgi:hypothetical protein
MISSVTDEMPVSVQDVRVTSKALEVVLPDGTRL